MKRLLVLVAVLSLIAGTAFAASMDEGITRDVWAQSKGRSVVSDGSVMMRIWYKGTSTPLVGISPTSVILYENGAPTTISASSYAYEVGKMANYINSLSAWGAVAGPDVSSGTAVNIFIVTAAATPGTSKQNPTYVYDDFSTRKTLFCGVEATENKINRIKQVVAHNTTTSNGDLTYKIWDGDTVCQRWGISPTANNSTTHKNASPNTTKFTDDGAKGLAGGMGNSLCVTATYSGTVDYDPATTSAKTSENELSILYDQF